MKTRKGYLILRNKTYYACWTVAGKKFVKTTSKTVRREAEKRLAVMIEPFLVEDEIKTLQNVKTRIEGAKTELAILNGKRKPPISIVATWDNYEKASNRPDSGKATLGTYALQWGCFERWLVEKHPDIKSLRGVNMEIAGEYAAHLSGRGVTANTFNKHVRVCELVFRVLKDKAMIEDNPWEHIERKKGLAPQSRRELTVEELKRICQSAEGELRLMLALGLYLGARLADAATMEWGNIDLKRGLIRYMPRKTARRNGKELTVPLHPTLANILAEIPPGNRKGYILPEMAKLYTETGPYAVSKIVQQHFEKNGIVTKREGHGVRKVTSAGFHSLRHSAVSLLREAGAPLSVTMAIVGHSTLAMHDTYTHVGEKAMKEAVASMPVLIGNAPALPLPKMIAAAPISALADKLNGKNWQAVKKELLTLAKQTNTPAS
ncbi:MAG: site-specific integrase [Verrucomicrobia bacterium]|nr:site-specific integrase [Verrucomicrobiota bacterium]MBU1856256.1 site-specific integrase [Verrucomicrobiota bacterium]